MSEIRATTISDAAGTGPITLTGQSAAKAWWQFDQYYTNTIIGSLNVSSGVDGGTGIFTANFANSMADTSYSVANSLGGLGSYNAIYSFDVGGNFTSSSLQGLIRLTATPSTPNDANRVMAEIHGDLA